MSKCGKCCGNCGSCGGNTLELTEGELNILRQLGQIPFLPVGRKSDDMTPIYPEDAALVLQCLEKRELITIDPDPIAGSQTLTLRNSVLIISL